MRFFRDLKKYRRYITYSAGAVLKSEVAGSYLSWAWWVLDPLLFMLVYTFVAQVVFRTQMEHFRGPTGASSPGSTCPSRCCSSSGWR